MFRTHVENGSSAPLVAEFRTWSWEWNHGDNLLELTACLQREKDWPLLKGLCGAVVARRRTIHIKTKIARKAVPDKIPKTLVVNTSNLLLDSVRRLLAFVDELFQPSNVEDCADMFLRFEKRIKVWMQ